MSHTFCSDCQQTEKIALRLIARAEQSVSGLIRKLEKRGCDHACINEVISRLSDLNLINDKRFAQLWLESRLRLTRSPKRLLVSLCSRGIDRDEAETAIKSALNEETELQMLTRFAKKYSKKNKDPRSLKFFLKTEGFSTLAIQRFFDEE